MSLCQLGTGICALALAIPLVPANAQSYCAPIQAAKERTYGFNPTKLEKNARAAKSAQMDAFWTLVKSYQADGVTCLRNTLAAEKNDGFFLFDGASLLYSIDKSDASIHVVVSSLERADLEEVDTRGYLQILLNLSRAGVDIGPLANRYLRRKDVDTFVPQHAMELNRDMGALFIYGSLPDDTADRYLIEALHYEEPYARATAALLLATILTQESFKALHDFQGLRELPADYQKEIQGSRTYAKYEAPQSPPTYSREEVIEYVRSLPHTREELDVALRKQREWEVKQPPPPLPPKVRTPQSDKKFAADLQNRIEKSPPFTEIEDHESFIESAIANLTEADLPLIRESRRKSLRGLSDESLGEYFAFSRVILGVINRLDLYREYRIH